jgi:hypothetical protein
MVHLISNTELPAVNVTLLCIRHDAVEHSATPLICRCCVHDLSVLWTFLDSAVQVSKQWIWLLRVQSLLRWGLEYTCMYPAAVAQEPRPYVQIHFRSCSSTILRKCV